MTSVGGLRPGWRFETLAPDACRGPVRATGAIVPPINQVSTFQQDDIGVSGAGCMYSRTGNPTRDELAERLAALESGSCGLAFASGFAAFDALLRTACRPGDHVVLPNDAYAGTVRLFSRILGRWGLTWTAAPTDPCA